MTSLAVLYEFFLRRSFLSHMSEELAASLNRYFVPYERLTLAGVRDIHEIFPTSDVVRGFANARSIRIVQTWIPDVIPMLRAMRAAAERGCKIQVLLLDPNSPVAPLRARELGYTELDATRQNVEANLAELRRFARLAGVAANLEVRLYDGLPVAAIHAYDDTIFMSLYWRQTPAIQGPQFEVRKGNSVLADTIELHIRDLWAAARHYDLGGEVGREEDG
ncbi:hypothetical protein CS0771_48530 [Catellatospora sp. IY07-71]|uniref:DUF5919 domain-containing protein n=1 Tax=Catellatospora sp. IY07-71 TaxID=2728827 RepID=UPI001BB2FB0F|nr:DUF5919 domain-containing protein [Catellatospora sp. IY07-71]BCJ75309.1 hypothetical protein CS0771_48530 [Catellatospora sp. IY07-71]